jgi:hypothetical protein
VRETIEKSQQLARLMEQSHALRDPRTVVLEEKQKTFVASAEMGKQWPVLPPKSWTPSMKEQKRPTSAMRRPPRKI